MTHQCPAAASSPQVAARVVEVLARSVTDVVMCPGSRNSPLSLALLARRDLRVHVRIDERSASFLALGMARIQRRRVAVLTTSGTAVAHCLPAMVEAAQSHTPLLVISADRPARLVGTGASQTIVQDGLFGGYARTVTVSEESDLERLELALRDARQLHVNVPLDMPLVDPERAPAPGSLGTHRDARGVPCLSANVVDHGEVTLDLSRRTLVIAGDEAWPVPGLEDVPTIAEPSAPAPYRPVHPLAAAILRRTDLPESARPEQIVVVGHPTLHRDVLALTAEPPIQVTVLSRTGTVTDPAQSAHAVGSRVRIIGSCSEEWLRIAEAASQVAAQAVREALADPRFGFTGLHAAAAVADTLAVGDTLFAAASNPVRDLALAGLPFDGVRTLSPRGAAGIDGTPSQAIGVALAAQAEEPEEPHAPRTVALMGDLSFLHDVGGLLIGPGEPRPENLVIVVANDSGGGIFATLEVGDPAFADSFERAFGTPHEANVAALCAGYGVAHETVRSLPELHDALERYRTEAPPEGMVVIEAVTTRHTRRELASRLSRSVGVGLVGPGASEPGARARGGSECAQSGSENGAVQE